MTQSNDRWLERWSEGETPWHMDEVHPVLQKHVGDWSRALVPLCGASLDLAWLVERGVQVVGVELSRRAVEQVFLERSWLPQIHHAGPYELWVGGPDNRLEVLVGDFFALDPEVVGTFDAVWDRAAIVAIDPDRRAEYVDVLSRVAPGADILLNVIEYPEGTVEGPPFSVSDEFVENHFVDAERIEPNVDLEMGGFRKAFRCVVPDERPVP